MQELLKTLFLESYSDLYGYFYGLTRDTALSEELTAQVFLEAVKFIGRFRGESSLKTWLFSIARNQWHLWLRRKKRTPEFGELTEPEGAGSPEEELLRRETAERIRQLLALEPERSRRIFTMRLEGCSFFEIGQALGISESSARVIHYRLRVKLRNTLIQEGYGYE